MIKVGIIGSAGYTGGELIRLLLNHPEAKIVFAQSSSQAGKPVSQHHGDLVGETDMLFTAGHKSDADVVFFCGGHGKTREFLMRNELSKDTRIIDLSSDYRINPSENGFVYGLPELDSEKIKASRKVANPGCFATAIQLALLPLAEAGLVQGEVHVNAVTGSTGAGAGLSGTSHFSWRNNNVSVYKAFNHQHLDEILQSLRHAQKNFSSRVNFIPVRGNFSRGILASVYLDFKGTTKEAESIFNSYYSSAPFTHVASQNPHLKQVVNTNKCLVFPEVYNGKLLIISIIDNLLKGASGQAIQNMNLMFGVHEKSGLELKGTSF